MADLYFDEEPEAQLTRLERDRALAVVFRAIEQLDVLSVYLRPGTPFDRAMARA